MPKRSAGIHEIEAFTALNAKVDSIYKRLNQLSINPVHFIMQVCELCAGQHVTSECQAGNPFATSSAEPAHYISNSNRQQNNLYSNNYNPRRRNHPNFYGAIIKIM